jgi:hypothetical protein
MKAFPKRNSNEDRLVSKFHLETIVDTNHLNEILHCVQDDWDH